MRFNLLSIFLCSLLATASYADNPLTNSLTTTSPFSAPQFLPVEEAYQPYLEFDGDDSLRLHWQIADDYYMYRDQFNFQLFDGEQWLTIDVEMPAGEEQEDEYFGRSIVYRFQTDIDLSPIPHVNNGYLVVTSQGCADAGLCYPPHQHFFQLNSETGAVLEQAALPDTLAMPGEQPSTTIAPTTTQWPVMLLLALIGGIILNLMPCVFPVLSLKVLSFTQDTTHSYRLHGLAYTVGVVFSFVLVAVALLLLRAAGSAVGWGFQLQSPWFVAAMAYLFFVMGLGLSGVVQLGAHWANIGNRLSTKPGYTGSFFTGMLATLVASPCTAPFMGAALGFALTQSAAVSLSVFIALGFGMALPMLVLSCSPTLLKRLPKPGAWMETLQQLLAFPLYLTALWLCWVVGKQAGVNAMGLVLVGLVLLAFACWLWRDNRYCRTVSVLGTVLALALLTSSLLNTRYATNSEEQTYTPELLAQLRTSNQPVLINATADWCITCLVNEKTVLSSDAVQQALQDGQIHYLKADWTRRAPEVTELLAAFGRSGVPLYLVYPADPMQAVIVLPQLLTKNSVLAALDQAVRMEGQ